MAGKRHPERRKGEASPEAYISKCSSFYSVLTLASCNEMVGGKRNPKAPRHSSSCSARRRSLRLLGASPTPTPPPRDAAEDNNVRGLELADSTHPVRVEPFREISDSKSSKGKGKGHSSTFECCGGDDISKGFLNLRSGKAILKRGTDANTLTKTDDDKDSSGGGGGKRCRKMRHDDRGLMGVSNSVDTTGDRKGKGIVVGASENENGHVVEHVGEEGPSRDALLPNDSQESSSGGHSTEAVKPLEDNATPQRQEQLINGRVREFGSARNQHMQRFRDIARANASRYAHFAADEGHDPSPDEAEVENESEDWPGPIATAMKIIKDRALKGAQAGGASSGNSSPVSIEWVPKRNQGHMLARFSIPSLQQLCLDVLAKNADAIVSLNHVPDAIRHKLSQLLCDGRKMNTHYFELLVRGSPTEIRLRDCSWMNEEQFTESFQMCNTASLAVLQLDQCGRCLPDYVLRSTLAQMPRHLPRLTSLSLRGACRLSDEGLHSLVSSAPALQSINLSQCSLLTSTSLYILADSLGSLLRELYLDDCQGIDAAQIEPALTNLEHLEVLSVAGIQTICDDFIKGYIIARGHDLKELVLRDCVKLTDLSMKVIAEHCPQLCALDIMNLSKLTDSSMVYLTNGCQALQLLKLCCNAFSDEAIAAFLETVGESLKELSLNNVRKVGQFTALSLASRARNLNTLDLSWCRNLTDNAVGVIVDGCSSLKLLKLFGCTQITDVFLNGHSNPDIHIIGLKMSPLSQHVKVPNDQQHALHYSSVYL